MKPSDADTSGGRHVLDLVVLVGDRPVESETTAEGAGADTVLVISSTLAGLTLRSVYVGGGAPDSHVLHLVQRRDRLPAIDTHELGDRQPTIDTHEVLPSGEMPVMFARELCLHNHAARLLEILEDLEWANIRVEVDAAAAAIGAVYPSDGVE